MAAAAAAAAAAGSLRAVTGAVGAKRSCSPAGGSTATTVPCSHHSRPMRQLHPGNKIG